MIFQPDKYGYILISTYFHMIYTNWIVCNIAGTEPSLCCRSNIWRREERSAVSARIVPGVVVIVIVQIVTKRPIYMFLQIPLKTFFSQTIGFVLGPAIQAALTPLGCSQEYSEGVLRWKNHKCWSQTTFAQLSLDMYTLTGWISVAVGFLSLLLFLPGVFQVFVSYSAGKIWRDCSKSKV